ncbi:hypothetical protein EAG_11650 [Camponotus floridanus]|uniref:CCHC-type domain-containing protein n=1 Tax=Camponotus floridanus TaxID=104421 RepID=E2AAY4_CAMFO|nr:hypothetical protein EAG_11650 [Camponotus floridanus]
MQGEERPPSFKQAIQETIKKQALINFQIGLRDELKILVRSRNITLQKAIKDASTEEKLIGPSITRAPGFSNKNKFDTEHARPIRDTNIQCYKCGNSGHYIRYVDVETWRDGDMEMWRNGEVEMCHLKTALKRLSHEHLASRIKINLILNTRDQFETQTYNAINAEILDTTLDM